jgi:hypothetical protein
MTFADRPLATPAPTTPDPVERRGNGRCAATRSGAGRRAPGCCGALSATAIDATTAAVYVLRYDEIDGFQSEWLVV